MPESERRSSLSALPALLRRRKTISTEHNEQETEAAQALGGLFFALPSEIISQIITHLTLKDILTLRLTSRALNTILNYNASQIIREVFLESLDPATSQIPLYLFPTPRSLSTLSHLFTMLRRRRAINLHIHNLLAFVQMKIYMTRTATRVLSVSDNRQRLTEAFQRPAWFVTHFLDRYRAIVIHEHPTHGTAVDCGSCHVCRDTARRIVDEYPAEDITPAYHFYQLVVEHLQIATRPPMAATPLERRIRGWNKSFVTEESLAIFVVLGGIPEVHKVAMMQGSYNSRVGFVAEFVERVREAVAVNSILDEKSQTKRIVVRPVKDKDKDKAVLPDALDPPFEILTQHHIKSLPNITRFFSDIWRDRIQDCAIERENISEPYPWLQRVMAGSGLEFGHSRTPEPPLALGASPI